MASNVAHLAHRISASRLLDAADQIRAVEGPSPVADLLAAVGEAMRTTGRPPLSDVETLRWSAVVHHAGRVAAPWCPR